MAFFGTAATEQDAVYTILVSDIKPIFVDLAKALARSTLSDLASFLRSEKSLFDLRSSIKHRLKFAPRSLSFQMPWLLYN